MSVRKQFDHQFSHGVAAIEDEAQINPPESICKLQANEEVALEAFPQSDLFSYLLIGGLSPGLTFARKCPRPSVRRCCLSEAQLIADPQDASRAQGSILFQIAGVPLREKRFQCNSLAHVSSQTRGTTERYLTSIHE